VVSGPHGTVPEPSFNLGLFREPERARRDLEATLACAPAQITQALPLLLADSPNPDQALSLLERFISNNGGEWKDLLCQSPKLLHYAIVVFSHSYWLGETLLQHPDILCDLQKDKDLEVTLGRENYSDRFVRLRPRPPQGDIAQLLALFRKREYIRIALRDCLNLAGLAEITEEISALSEAIIEIALRESEARMRDRFRGPEYRDAQDPLEEAPFAVLSLGKLGGNELNYSSDVDLLYLYSTAEDSGALREYFIRQAQLLTDILSRSTPEGAVFRIDLRLRPQGSEGEPAIGLRHALHYYAHNAHDWELQALIKARHSAGNRALATAFIEGVQRYVYTENVNFEAIATALHSRERMRAQRRRLQAGRKDQGGIDVKLDRGGIRDIEFLAQCLQRVYGGEERWLRSSGTLFSLQKLHDKGHLSGGDFHELAAAYRLLRKVEHRLQLQRGQQVHMMPRETAELRVLERAVDTEARDREPGSFVLALRSGMARVAEVYDRVLSSERYRRRVREAERIVAQRPANIRELTLDQVLQRIAVEAPDLHEVVTRVDLDLHGRRNLTRFLTSALTSPARYASLLENPEAVGRAISLLQISDYLTDILVRHPDVVRDLAGPASAPVRVVDQSIPQGMREVNEATSDTNAALALLRRDFRRRVFAAGAKDALSPRAAFVSMDEITGAGKAAIAHALQIVNGQRSLAVFALGRLGTGEFDIASDADLLLVRAPEADDNQARLDAERLVHALGAYTREGTVFAVDSRLRPRGGAGELVVTPGQIERYLADEAQAWEALSYTKLCFVAGRQDLSQEVLTPAWNRIVDIAFQPEFAPAVREMRARLEKSNRYLHSFKLARGGFYDIDFLASYLMLKSTSPAQGSTIDRLRHLQQAGALDPTIGEELVQAAILYRTADHVIRLVTGRARPELPEAEHARAAVEQLVSSIVDRDPRQNLQAQLEGTAVRVRKIFDRLILC
jgi:glutamate-ammonia-ligase adenylyltransferase